MVYLDYKDCIRLLQLSDTHLNAPENGHLLGMKTLDSLRSVLDVVDLEHPVIDLVLVTGDLSQDGSVESYRHLRRELDRFESPCYWLPGNHDNQTNMDLVAADKQLRNRVIKTPHWQIILLDTQVEGQVYGELAEAELWMLQQQLQAEPDLHTLIAFHHHPIAMGSRWIDTIGIRNSEALLALVNAYDNVRCLIWGHVHQASDQLIDGVRYLSTPSTCVQFEPHSKDFSVDRRSPGYRWLELYPDGRIETSVSRVDHIEFEVDYSVKGY
ncbi:3',5'-cyclic-AMP phosphodiesterase [Oceanobacter mangrovi]|uniref:3',5'-cyclic-AMP phosphodiesterase n=1 Tax=Oceanobacter mangrovi TaxID=2862510 RepID=UPI001C8DFBFA|nr:3',5'-cyclic-AMP phosphodiesterase [Oceanobacter mangrovi]